MIKTTNTYGLTIKGLRKTAGETKGLQGYYSGQYLQISYDMATGDIYTNYHCSFGQNSWSEYHDSDIIRICNASDPMTMQDIADAIYEAVQYRVA